MARDRSQRSVPCPNCGELIPARALACRECGSDAETGWSDETYLDGLDLPDTEGYEAFLESELGIAAPGARGRSRKRLVRNTLLIILALSISGALVFLLFLMRIL